MLLCVHVLFSPCVLRRHCQIIRSLSLLCRTLPPLPGLRYQKIPSPKLPPVRLAPGKRVDEAWPRKATRGDETISMYQPQLEAWKGDELRAYAALAVMSTTNKTTKYGVVWFTARTEVDKVNRQVTLDNFENHQG